MKYIAPSILSADLANIKDEIVKVQQAGIKYLHIDVMDGNFVPNITIGQPYIKSLRKISDMTFDVHLMIEKPERYIEQFAKAGADMLTVHVEACTHLDRAIHEIKKRGMKAGVSINPSTPVEMLMEVLGIMDLVLVMSVNPGFGGQSFIPNSLKKVKKLYDWRRNGNYDYLIEVDGGVNTDTISDISRAGADILVAGSAVFSNGDVKRNIEKLCELI